MNPDQDEANMYWDENDERDVRILLRGRWCELCDGLSHFPDDGGVFIFTDADRKVIYIGLASPGHLRLEAITARDLDDRACGATRAQWFVAGDQAHANSLHRYLVGKYEPANY
jgi:excinuclease UvrABC nuclease subunit